MICCEDEESDRLVRVYTTFEGEVLLTMRGIETGSGLASAGKQKLVFESGLRLAVLTSRRGCQAELARVYEYPTHDTAKMCTVN